MDHSLRWTASAAIAVLAACGLPGCRKQPAGTGGEPLLCYVGGTMRPAMEKIAEQYRAKTGRTVLIDYAGSGELLIKIRATRRGDLFVCHDPFGAGVWREGLADRVWAIASMGPVIVVPKGNPKNIRGVRDLVHPGIRLILTDREYSTVGHVCTLIFRRAGLVKKISANIVSRTRGGGAAANAVSLGTADAAIVWSAVAWLRRDKLDAVPIEPEFQPRRDVDAVTTATYGRIDMDYLRVALSVLKCSKQKKAAEDFAAFVRSKKGQTVFAEFGFSPVDSTRPASWETASSTSPPHRNAGDQPGAKGTDPARTKTQKPPVDGTETGTSLLVHCGAGLRRPVSAILEQFTEQTGVRVATNYSGSNVLLSQIELTRKGDIYIPGDADYVEMARKKGLVLEDRPFCWFEPVILVRRGNPKHIRGIPDLARSGTRLGLGDEKACAIGRLLPRILKRNGMAPEHLHGNRLLSTMTVNELGIAVKLGSIDAAIVWRPVAALYKDSCDIVDVPARKNAVVPVRTALLNTSTARTAARKLLDFLGSAPAAQVLRRYQYQVEKP